MLYLLKEKAKPAVGQKKRKTYELLGSLEQFKSSQSA